MAIKRARAEQKPDLGALVFTARRRQSKLF